MERDLFPGFATRAVDCGGVTIHCRVGGEGPPLLMLHGYPQSHATWHRVAPGLARHFTCVVADLPGYGASSVPEAAPDHRPYTKRAMGQAMAKLMERLGFRRFHLLGHDRGARVAYRLALDQPERVERLGIIEVIPTAELWARFSAELALKTYHWTFLAQPAPLPERMIGADPVAYLDWTLASWAKGRSLAAFEPAALEAYRRAFTDPARIHAMCEDYRAGAGLDRAHDERDRAAGRRIAAPLHFVWAAGGFPAATGDPLGIWRAWADEVSGNEIDAGHFGQEENPEAVLAAFVPFFVGDGM